MSEMARKSAAQNDAEAEVEHFRKDLGPFVVAAERTRMALVFTDAKVPRNPIIFANDSFLSLTGYGREELLGREFGSLLLRCADPVALTPLEAEFEGCSDSGCENDYRRKDGSEFWAATFISPVRDESGDVVQNFVSLVDLTKHKQERAHSRTLIDELNHRVKNTLATVQLIVRQAMRKATDPAVIRESIESRLFALARSHDLLTRENWQGAGLVDLVNAALEPFGIADGRAGRLIVTGENIRLTPKATLALGVAFHELATNAVRSGAFSNDTGSILIGWTIEPAPAGNRLVLHWQEKDGPPVAPPPGRGFGAQVIEHGLAHELEAVVQLDYRADGLVCTIDIPAPRAAA
jgi:PAS domain S-box-containing protein